MSHAKDAKGEKIGYDRRVCVAVLVDRFGTREQIDGGDPFANVANGVDRGTYRPAPIVSRKGAKGRPAIICPVSRDFQFVRFMRSSP
jgi:hypothetical protein